MLSYIVTHHGYQPNCQVPGAEAQPTAEIPHSLRGDVGVHEFWSCGTTATFDVRITDTAITRLLYNSFRVLALAVLRQSWLLKVKIHNRYCLIFFVIYCSP